MAVYICILIVYSDIMPKKSSRGKSRKRITDSKFVLVILGCLVALFVVFNFALKQPITCGNSISCVKDLSGKFDPAAKPGIFLGEKINPPRYLAEKPVAQQVLGATTGTKHIYVDLATQKLTAYEGENKIYEFPVATGKWHPTPTGDFKIWIKLRYTRMSGGSGADYYNLPNVPYVMFFYNNEVSKSAGFSIHGAYWHDNFGYPMSHGCVNMRPEDAAVLFAWADPVSDGSTTYATADNPGTEVTISGQPPE